MSLASLVTAAAAPPSSFTCNSSNNRSNRSRIVFVSRGISQRGLVQAHIRRRFPSSGVTCNISLGSSILGGCPKLDRVWRDRRHKDEGFEFERGLKKCRSSRSVGLEARASSSLQDVAVGVMDAIKTAWMANPPTWESAFTSMGAVFVVGSPLLFVGLTNSGIASAYLLGSVIWRAYGGQGLLTIMAFYIIGTAATKLKMKEKQKEGIAEKRGGKRGVGSVVGSGTAAAVCALCSIYGIGGPDIAPLWQLGYLASLCTKLSDTISSEIGKAYGKTTYLVTTLSVVPRGTEGAVSVEGTVAGLVAAIFLAAAAYSLGQVDKCGAIIAVGASQLANLFESFLGATLQGRPGYEWLSNDLVNIANVTVGALLAILLGKYFGSGL
ncbi:unnamed protein product [Calypogeia fissa]